MNRELPLWISISTDFGLFEVRVNIKTTVKLQSSPLFIIRSLGPKVLKF